MEGYEIIKRLGKGAQGVVYSVRNKRNKKEYVMKKIECTDETQANKAFTEAMALKDLQHPYICGYREFFVNWDKEIKAITVCIVMDHYACGDLQNLLNIRRGKKEPFKVEIIKKWLGQIIEVLKFIHAKGVIHRDLKPSNLFLKDESLDLVVGDFGVSTIMGDIKIATRTAVGSFRWMAPEVTKRPYDERSDVWSVGVILLQLMTCHALSESELKLDELSANPAILENILKIISQTYPNELVAVVRQMMRVQFEQRPTSEELSKMAIISECLALANPAKIARSGRQQVQVSDRPVPVGEGLSGVIAYLKKERQNENCVSEALKWISEQDNLRLDNDEEVLVAQAMNEHSPSIDVCKYGTKIFGLLSIKAREKDAMFTGEVMKAIIRAVVTHSASMDVQSNFIDYVVHLSSYESAPTNLGKVGAIQCVLDVMKTFPKSEDLNANACHSLLYLCSYESNAKIALSEGAVATICTAMRAHDLSPTVLQHAASAMYTLAIEDDCFEVAKIEQLVHLLLSSMKSFIEYTDLVKYSMLALSSLVQDEEMALRFIECQGSDPKSVVQGIPILKEAYRVHEDNIDVVRAICDVLDSLLRHQDIKTAIVGIPNLREFVAKIHKRYVKDKNIAEACASALESLEE